MTDSNAPVVPGPTTHLPRTERYLRNRPFLVVNLLRRPTNGVRTEKLGWQEITGSLTTYEQPSLVDRVNDTHMRNAAVIIDVLNGKCVKNMFSGTPGEEVVNHYLEKYRPQVTEAMDIWLSQVATKVAAKKTADGVYSAA